MFHTPTTCSHTTPPHRTPLLTHKVLDTKKKTALDLCSGQEVFQLLRSRAEVYNRRERLATTHLKARVMVRVRVRARERLATTHLKATTKHNIITSACTHIRSRTHAPTQRDHKRVHMYALTRTPTHLHLHTHTHTHTLLGKAIWGSARRGPSP